MKEIRFNNQKDLIMKTMIERLEFFEKQGVSLEVEIKRSAKESEDVKLLMSIPGIDYYLASRMLMRVCGKGREWIIRPGL